MTKRRSNESSPEEIVTDSTPEAPQGEAQAAEKTPEPEAPTPVEKDTSLEPAVVTLQTPQVTELKPQQSKEEIEAAIQEKLSNRDTSGDPGSEVNRQQLRNEVKHVAEQFGFPLSRGTEAGAALLARARNRNTR